MLLINTQALVRPLDAVEVIKKVVRKVLSGAFVESCYSFCGYGRQNDDLE